MNEGPICLFVRPTQLHAIDFAGYVGDLGVWLARSYGRREFDADGAIAAGMILRRFDDDAPIHLIRQRGHDPYISCEVFEVHASIVLAGMMMLVRRLRAVAVTPQPEIGRDLVGTQEGAHFKVRSQMHRPQMAVQLTDGSRLSGDAIAVGAARREQLIQRPFMGNHFVTEWPGRRAHAVEDKLQLPRLILGQ